MVTTQSFRLRGKSDVKDIVCNQVEEENVIVWEDIEQVFPGVSYIANGNTVVSMMRDSNRNRVTPQCIKQYPGVVLDVILSTTSGDSPSESSTGAPSAPQTNERPSAPTMTSDLEAEIVQRVASSLTPEIQAQLRVASNGYDLVTQAVKDGQVDPSNLVGRFFQELKAEMAKNMELSIRVAELIEKKEPHTRSLDQMALIQKRSQSLLSRNYKLYENPIPRLFVVLPMVHPSSWNSQDSFSNTFRLYFLCDCGRHTMSNSSGNSHHIHLAKHEGYDITHPKEFFQEYGHYVLTVLQMLKYGFSVAGTIVPALLHLARSNTNGQSSASLRFLESSIESGIELTTERVKKALANKGGDTAGFSAQVDNSEALEGVDLQRLETFMKIRNEDKVFGNLFRTVTPEGYVNWVCIDHYREIYQEAAATAFRDTVTSVKGSFDENLGRVEVMLKSRDEADQFYLALENAKTVYELKIDLDWSTTQSDFIQLRDTLTKTAVGVLELDLNFQGGPDSDSANHPRRHDPILDIMRQRSIHSVKLIQLPRDFVQRSTLLKHTDNFPNLRYLDLDLRRLDSDVPGCKTLVAKTSSNLLGLVFQNTSQNFLQVLEAVVEFQTYPITSRRPNFCLLPQTSESPRSAITIRDKADMLKTLGGRIEQVELDKKGLEAPALSAFANATVDGSRLKRLAVLEVGRNLGEQSIKDLVSVISRSEIHTMDIDLEGEVERVHILESIQWKHIRDMTISMDERSHGMRPLKIVADRIADISEGTQMDRFVLRYKNSRSSLASAQEQLLRSIVASTPLKHLHLDVPFSVEQVLSIAGSADLSQMQYINLRASGIDSIMRLNAILQNFDHATELRTIVLHDAGIGKKHIEQMMRKGITLSNK